MSEHLKLVPKSGTVDTLIGQVLDGRYEVEKVLGEGGMGIVYKARHVTLGKPLAIKVLKSDVSKDQEIVQRFRQEAQSATAIGNHHIIDISDFGALPDGSTFFVMEYLDGISLTRAIEPGKPLKVARTIHIAKQLCRALGAAHEVGIVHRDLKPDNIYLIARGGDRDFVKVLDFGIAKVGGQKSKLTQVGQVFGTPHYMSPEQCAGTPVDKRTDIYALGVIMYEMTSSRVPFDADNLMGILTKHLYEEPVRPHDLPPPVDVPAALEAVIMKCLAKKADARYQTMQELLADLELVEQGLTPSAVVEGVRRASLNGRSDPTQRTSSAGQRASTGGLTMDVGTVELPKTSSTGLILGGLLLFLLVAVGSYYAFSSNRDDGRADVVAPEPGRAAVGATPGATPGAGEPTGAVADPAPSTPPAGSLPPEPVGQVVPQPPEPPAAVVPASPVQLASTPPGAEVRERGSVLGRTPLAVERPAPGAGARELVLALPGYRDAPVRVAADSRGPLEVSLQRKRPIASAPAAPSPPAVQAPEPPRPTEEPRRPRPRPATEVLDPWN